MCAKKKVSMKKLLSVVTLLGALAGAASAAPYVLPAPAGGALTPYDWQPVYSIEGLYSFAADSEDPDMPGIRGSFSLYSNAESRVRHQFNINVGYMSGDIKEDGWKQDLELIPLTLGYNINLGLADSVFVYLGAKAGYAWAKEEVTSPKNDKWSDSSGGFTYSVGAGIKVQCSDSIYVHAGYEFGRTYIDVDDDDANHYIYGAHSVILGIGCTF